MTAYNTANMTSSQCRESLVNFAVSLEGGTLVSSRVLVDREEGMSGERLMVVTVDIEKDE